MKRDALMLLCWLLMWAAVAAGVYVGRFESGIMGR